MAETCHGGWCWSEVMEWYVVMKVREWRIQEAPHGLRLKKRLKSYERVWLQESIFKIKALKPLCRAGVILSIRST
jgi:hypothetical protein